MLLENKEEKKVWTCNMTCQQQQNLETKWMKKLNKYQQLAFKIRERQLVFEITVVPVIIGAIGGGLKKTIGLVLRILPK